MTDAEKNTDILLSALPAPEPPSGPPRKSFRGRAALFVLVFLACTLALFMGYRFAIGTPAMNWYLFQVARHTAWLLDTIGYAAILEPESYTGREAEIRAHLAAWGQGDLVIGAPAAASGVSAAPLTPWETWRYRYGKFNQEQALNKQQLARLEPLPNPEVRDPEAFLKILKEGIERFEEGLARPGSAGRTVQFAPPAVLEDFRELKAAFEAAVRSRGSNVVRMAETPVGIATRLNDLHSRQVAFLETEIDKKGRRLRDTFGPLILYVARPGVATRLQEARVQLAMVTHDASLDQQARQARTDALRTEIKRLRKAGQRRQGAASPDKEVSFRFNVIPDCGAVPSMAIFFSALVAFPTFWWKRLLGIAIGIPVLYIVNMIRLGCLAVIGAWDDGGEWFEFSHYYGWQGIYVIFVVVVWLLWIELVVKRGGGPWQKSCGYDPLHFSS